MSPTIKSKTLDLKDPFNNFPLKGFKYFCNMKTALYFFILFSIVLVSCQMRSSSKEEQLLTVEKKIELPDFNADTAYQFVVRQMNFGPRVPGTKAHERCARYLENMLSEYADHTEVQQFSAQIWNGEIRQGKNIIASFFPDQKTRVLLAAHWDSRPTADHDPNRNNWDKPVPGANDGASGVAVLLEVARQLAQKKPSIGIDIMFFDLEDLGTPEFETETRPDTWCLGSQFWANNPHKMNYKAYYGILLDMVGCKNPRFTKEGTSMYFAQDVMTKVWNTAKTLGFGYAFVEERTNSIIDDHLYINKLANIPMIDIIHYDPQTETRFFPYWHTVADDLSKIDKQTLKIVGQTVLAHIYQE